MFNGLSLILVSLSSQRRVSVAGDYFFLTDGGGGSQDQEFQVQMKNELGMDDESIDQARQEGKIAKCLIMRCHASKAIFTWMVPYKGDAEDGYVTDLMVKALKWFGYTRFIVKSDNEPALNRLVKSAIDKAKLEMPELRQIAEEHPTAYDSKANGAVESGVRNVRQDLRTAKADLQSRLGAHIPVGHPIMAWLVRHVGFTHIAFLKGSDGRTSWHKIRGRPYTQTIVPLRRTRTLESPHEGAEGTDWWEHRGQDAPRHLPCWWMWMHWELQCHKDLALHAKASYVVANHGVNSRNE